MAGPEKHSNSENDKTGPEKRSPILLIVGIFIVAVIIVAIILVVTSSGGLNSVAVGNVSRDVDGISFPVYATVEGTGEYDGDVTIEIYFEDMEDPVYSGKVSISDGDGTHEVDYTDFVWGNGDYKIFAKGNGQEDFQIMRIESVIEVIEPQWTGGNSDINMVEADFNVDVTIGYKFGNNRRTPRSEDPQEYRFIGSVLKPDGTSIDLDSDDFPANLLKITRSIDHTKPGSYSLSGSVTNEFCHPNSPFRTVEVSIDDSFTYDAQPFAVLGDDFTVDLVSGIAQVNISAQGSWDDSSIVEYTWYITGEGLDTSKVTTGPELQYSFTTAGEYIISLSVKDDASQVSMQNADVSSLLVTVQ